MVAADRAEIAGDAAFACQLMRAHPFGPDGRPFWRPWRVLALEQLVELGRDRPAWVTSRWMLAQALQHVDPASRDRSSAAFEATLDLLGDAALPGEGIDPCQIMDHDWVYRQLHLYEFGGLEDFVHRVASRELRRAGEDMKPWLRAAMGGYRLLGAERGRIGWEDLATHEVVTTLDTGSAALVLPGETVLGRLVPAGQDVIFEGVPLLVAPELAVAVAGSPADWLLLMRQAEERPDTYLAPGCGFASDVRIDVLEAMGGGLDLVLEAMELIEFGEFGELGEFESVPGDVDVWTYCAATLLRPGQLDVLAGLLGPEDAEVVAALGGRLAEPAASLCHRLAGRLRAAA